MGASAPSTANRKVPSMSSAGSSRAGSYFTVNQAKASGARETSRFRARARSYSTGSVPGQAEGHTVRETRGSEGPPPAAVREALPALDLPAHDIHPLPGVIARRQLQRELRGPAPVEVDRVLASRVREDPGDRAARVPHRPRIRPQRRQ